MPVAVFSACLDDLILQETLKKKKKKTVWMQQYPVSNISVRVGHADVDRVVQCLWMLA